MRQRGGTQVRVPPPGGYLGQVPPRGGYPGPGTPPGGYLTQVPPRGGYLTQVPPGGVPDPGTPPGGYLTQVPPPGGGTQVQVPPRGGSGNPPGVPGPGTPPGGVPRSPQGGYPDLGTPRGWGTLPGYPLGGGDPDRGTPRGWGYPGRTTEGVLTTRRAVCLLRSRRRTFLLESYFCCFDYSGFSQTHKINNIVMKGFPE